jgi:GNAT superfamily N-acetyltransferase
LASFNFGVFFSSIKNSELSQSTSLSTMTTNSSSPVPVLLHAEPVLAVSNIEATVSYWHETLGFPNKWTWGDPPNHGGVAWSTTFIQFTLNPALALSSKGNCIWIRVRHLDELYVMHQRKNADIVETPQDKPWGMTEYCIRDLNGYYVFFSAATSKMKSNSNNVAANFRITKRLPSAEEYRMLSAAVGWGGRGSDDDLQRLLSAPIYSLVAEDAETNQAIGCVLLLGDGVSFFYVKDLMVTPNWQHKGVGRKLMKELSSWLEAHASENAFIGLYTGETLSPFYGEFGFTPVFGMNKRILKH